MEWFVVLALLLGLILVFCDILLMLTIRFSMFLLLLWGVCLIHKSVTIMLMDSGLIMHHAVANLLGLAVVMFLCCSLLKWSSGVAANAELSDLQTVGIDVFRIGLLIAVGFALLITLMGVAAGKLLLISWVWLMILAVFASGIDVCFPSILGETVKVVSPKITSRKGGFKNVA
tara:strand:+ start:8745 stop:9263 length:519 start_codon:yes stop_codon:yes gene_type:complete